MNFYKIRLILGQIEDFDLKKEINNSLLNAKINNYLQIIRAFEFIVNWFKRFIYDEIDNRDPFSTFELS